MTEVKRHLFSILVERLNNKIIIIRGPRRSGKTYLLSQIKQYLLDSKKVNPQQIIVYNGDDDSDKLLWEEKHRQELNRLFSESKSFQLYVFFDEFQKVKKLSEKIKLIVDSDVSKKIKFFLTGSSTLSISQKTSESLLGRAETYNLFPFSFTESLQITNKNISNNKKPIQDMLISFLNNPVKKKLRVWRKRSFFGKGTTA